LKEVKPRLLRVRFLLGVSGIHMFMVAIIIISKPWSSAAKLSPQRLGFDPLRSSLPRGQYSNSIISSSLPRQSHVLVYTCESVRRSCKLLGIQRGVLPTCMRLVNVRGVPRTAYKCVHTRMRAHVVAGNFPSTSGCLDPAVTASSLATAGSH
jgi:hypothetical protein